MIRRYFKSLYQDAMQGAYATAYRHIGASISPESSLLDCGANNGWVFEYLAKLRPLDVRQYHGIEWNPECAAQGRNKGYDIIQGDLNKGIAFSSDLFSCVFGLSVLEHLLNPCRFLRECHRVLKPGGRLVLLTPNISTYFTAVIILGGGMPSSGPHPDSDALIKAGEIFKVSSEDLQRDSETDTPTHRHLIVFSYKVLRRYLGMLGFHDICGQGFGLYPFPRFTQALLTRLDPYHCHQMVFTAVK